jgi:hypothetical protein
LKNSELYKNPYISFAINSLEVIPCYYEDTITYILGLKPEKTDEFNYHAMGVKIIVALIVIIMVYTFRPYINNWLIDVSHTPGIELVGKDPLPTNKTHLVKTYEELTGSPDVPIYNYGISFYVYITPTTGPDEYLTIINFTGNLFISYNILQNQLFIYAKQNSEDVEEKISLYKYKNFPLQKWVKIEINYIGGIYDVFVDNVIKTTNEVVSINDVDNAPDNVYVGVEGSSVIGQVKNFMYYKKPLNLKQIRRTK